MNSYSQALIKGCSIKELEHKACRQQYHSTADTATKVKCQMKGNKMYAVGFDGTQFVGIKLTANLDTEMIAGSKVWTSIMDDKTCNSCRQMNEQMVAVKEQFIFKSDKKTYYLDQPPLHGFNEVNGKNTTYAMPGHDVEHIGRFEEPTCRCMAIFVEKDVAEDEHFKEPVGAAVEYPEEIVIEDAYLKNVVIPINNFWLNGSPPISEQAYLTIARHFEKNELFYDKLIEEMKLLGPIQTLKNWKYI